MNPRSRVVLALLCVLALPLRAQTAAPVLPAKTAPQGKAAAFASEPLVVEQMHTAYTYAADGTGQKAIHAITRIQSEAAARQYSVLYVPYAAGNEEVETRHILVHKADGTVVETPATDAQDMPSEVTRLAPVYSDLRQKQYPIRSLGVGDTLEYEGVIRMTKAQAIAPGGVAQFWGTETLTASAVSLDTTLEIHLPRDGAVIVRSPRYKPEITDSPTERTFRWHTSQLQPTVLPPGAPKPPDPPATDRLPDIGWTSFPDWAAVGAWYRSIAVERAAPTPALKARADAIIQGAATDEEKVRRMYAFVSTNIRYIGVAFGLGRYQPHPASEVLANQYGDCKDKHTLLAALLTAEDFDAEPVLIGNEIKFDRELPAPSSFNHLITAVTLGDSPAHPGKRVFLDSTEEVAPYAALSPTLRDKEALVVPVNGPAVVVQTPATLPFPAFDHWEAHATLDKEGKLKGHFDVTSRSDLELLLRWSLHQTTASEWPQLGQNLSSGFGYGGTVTNFAPGSAEQTDAPLHYAYDYERDSYGEAGQAPGRRRSVSPGSSGSAPRGEL